MPEIALITGASRGIGRAAALLLARRGYQVAVGYHSARDAAHAVVQEIAASGGSAMAVQADVADSAQVQRMVREVTATLGDITLLVNNAGIAQSALLTDVTDEQWRTLLAVHVDGAFYCARAVLPAMIRRKAGCILNISSIWGMTGASCEVPYSTAKAALIGFTKALAKEVAPCGIRVNGIAPGAVKTEMLEGFTAGELEEIRCQTPLGRLGTPQDIAACIAYLASPDAGFITGQIISPNGGFVI